MVYNEIKHQKIKDLDRQTLNTWIEEEVENLANDFGQNIAPDMLGHICKRLRGALLGTYRSWAAGDVHAAFQVGMSGAYGTVHKVTVQRLFHWLKATQQTRAVKIATLSANTSRVVNPPQNAKTDFGAFVLWCSYQTPRIYLTNLAPDWNPTRENFTIPDTIRQYMSEFAQAKQKNLLPAFKKQLLSKAGVGV